MQENKSIYDLELHESVKVETAGFEELAVTRVPGGWLYMYYRSTSYGTGMTSSFVPYDNSFYKPLPKDSEGPDFGDGPEFDGWKERCGK